MTLRLAIRNLFRSPQRTLLVFFTLAVGAGALLAFRALNQGVLAEYRESSIHSRYGHGTIFRKGYWGKPLEKPWTLWIEDPAPVIVTLEHSPNITGIFPRTSFSALVTNGGKTLNGQGVGIDGPSERKFFDRLTLTEGEFLDGKADGILVGKGLARSLGARPGSQVTLLASTVHGSMSAGVFTVRGVFETGLKAIDDTAFRVELPAAQRLLDTKAVESISIALARDDAFPKLDFPGLELLPFEELDQIYYQNGARWLKSQAGVFEWIILFIVLLGIFNAIAVTILERSPELATARANGETKRDIFLGLVAEAAILGLAAAAVGMAAVWLGSGSLLPHGLEMPPGPGMTKPSQVFLIFRWNDATTVAALCLATVVAGAGVMAARVLRRPIVSAIRGV